MNRFISCLFPFYEHFVCITNFYMNHWMHKLIFPSKRFPPSFLHILCHLLDFCFCNSSIDVKTGRNFRFFLLHIGYYASISLPWQVKRITCRFSASSFRMAIADRIRSSSKRTSTSSRIRGAWGVSSSATARRRERYS